MHETFHLSPPYKVQCAWESHLKQRGQPGLDLRTQPAFHLTDERIVILCAMPLNIITDSETWFGEGSLKTQDIDEAVSKHFRIPVECIVDPCLVIRSSEAIPRLRIGDPLYDTYTPLGFLVLHEDQISDDEDEDDDDLAFHNPWWGMACWDWVFSDFALNVGYHGPVGSYFYQQNGDTYTLTLRKPDGLSKMEEAAWHADVPYGPFASFARAVEATFWPPTPPATFNSIGDTRLARGSNRSSRSPTFNYPDSPFPLASVPITRYKSGKPWDPKRLSDHAAQFGVSTPALGNIATHLRVVLPAQPSPLPEIRSGRSPRAYRRTASAMNSPSKFS